MTDLKFVPASRPALASWPSGRGLRDAAIAALLGAAGMLGGAGAPASAADQAGWQIGCAYRAPSGIPGTGQAMLNDLCARLRYCQSMSDHGKPGMSGMGCFGFEPAQRASKPAR